MTARAVLLLALALVPLASAAPEQVHLSVADTRGGAPVFAANWLDGVAPPPGEEGATWVPGPSAGFVYERRLDGNGTYALGERAFEHKVPRPLAQGLRIVALGDMGVSEQAGATVAAVMDLDPDLVLHAGDLSYAQGDPAGWKAWFQLVEPAAATRPWMPALGNHETYTGPGPAAAPWAVGGVASPLELEFWHQRFALPGNELWYSFDWAGVHFVALETFTASGGRDDGPLPEAEVAWLEQDLRANEAAPWTIVFLHQPPYSSGEHGDSARVQEAFVPLFERYGVDLVIGGHDHTYERSYPLRGGAPTQRDARDYTAGEGVLYLVTGGAGQSLYDLSSQQPAWSAARASVYHVVELAITPDAIAGRVVPTAGDSFADAWRIAKPPAGIAGDRAAPGWAPLLLVLVLAFAARQRR